MGGCIRPPIISVLITVKAKARVALIQKVPNGQSVRVRKMIIQSNLQNVKKPAFRVIIPKPVQTVTVIYGLKAVLVQVAGCKHLWLISSARPMAIAAPARSVITQNSPALPIIAGKALNVPIMRAVKSKNVPLLLKAILTNTGAVMISQALART